jgi:fructosamine-3-kinase
MPRSAGPAVVNRAVQNQLASALGAELDQIRAVSGGDINQAYRVQLRDGRAVFVKTHPHPPAGMYAAEAAGLAWLAEPGALRVPRVWVTTDRFLAMEYIESGARARDYDDRLGRGLAALHRSGADQFGLAQNNYIGSLAQDNTPAGTWTEFYRQRRLQPQLHQASDAGLVDRPLRRDFDRLFARLDELVGPSEPPARLHGDLWSGNAHVDSAGLPCLIDPAAYGGHREVDLAMMELFGGFGPRTLAAYDEAWPLDVQWRERVPLYQLYPLLVHLNLFGGTYLGAIRRALDRLV